MSRAIDDALGINPLTVIVDEEENINLPAVIGEEQVEEDVAEARENLGNAIELSQQAVQDMLTIAQQSQHPKAYEVLNSMIKTYADVSMGLVDLQVKRQRLEGKKKQEEGQQTINNNLFVGSTADLQKMLEDMKSKNA
jgi:hypothetical protein